MKKFIQGVGKCINVLYKILPFFIGIRCYYPYYADPANSEKHPIPLLDAVYSSLKLYYGATEGDIRIGGLLELGRFLALAATLSILISAFNKMTDVVNWFKLRRADSTVVYGNSVYADHMFKSLRHRSRIHGGEKFIKNASRYLIVFENDAQNLEFYNKNYECLKDRNVYIMLNDISRQNIENHRLTVFSIAENCARQYWRDHPVEKSERIAIIGFENLGKNILLYGLQMNIIDPEQHFEYHIYGDGREFRQEHSQLDEMKPDEIIFHDDGMCDFAEMTDFDRIIICGNSDESCNITALSKLLAAAPVKNKAYVYAPNGNVVTNLFGSEKVICFGAIEETASIDAILNERSMEAARSQHEFYQKQYGGTPWEKLDAFKRYSNVSSSDYMYTVSRLIEKGVPFEIIAELEHIRWNRYHYLNNWKYGDVRDDSRRIHNCLIPFSELSEEEKLKDVEAIKSKFQK